MCRSLPQMPAAVTRTTAPRSSGSTGSGTEDTRTSRGPWYVSALTVGPPSVPGGSRKHLGGVEVEGVAGVAVGHLEEHAVTPVGPRDQHGGADGQEQAGPGPPAVVPPQAFTRVAVAVHPGGDEGGVVPVDQRRLVRPPVGRHQPRPDEVGQVLRPGAEGT